jgi:hypothetical protein
LASAADNYRRASQQEVEDFDVYSAISLTPGLEALHSKIPKFPYALHYKNYLSQYDPVALSSGGRRAVNTFLKAYENKLRSLPQDQIDFILKVKEQGYFAPGEDKVKPLILKATHDIVEAVSHTETLKHLKFTTLVEFLRSIFLSTNLFKRAVPGTPAWPDLGLL